MIEDIDINDIDIERLRNDLINYFEGAYFVGGFGAALIDLSEVENASDYEIVQIAINNGFDISKYIKNNGRTI